MDKETLSNYGWIVICILVLSVLLALATPFGNFIADGFKSAIFGLFDTQDGALSSVLAGLGVDIFDDTGEDGDETHVSTPTHVYYRIGSSETLSITFDAPYKEFKRLKVNDTKLVLNQDYTVSKGADGNAMVTFTASYINKLTEGDFQAKLVAQDGYALADLTTVYTNALDLTKVTPGYIGKDGAINTTVTTLSYTGRIPVKAGDKLTFWHFGTSASNTQARFVTAYDASGNVVASASTDYAYDYTVPSGVASVSVTLSTGSINQMMIIKNTDNTPTRYIPFNDDDSGVVNLGALVNVLDMNNVEIGSVAKNGVIRSDMTTLLHTKRIQVNEGDKFICWTFTTNGCFKNGMRFITAYGENDRPIESAGLDSSDTYVVPAGVESVVFTISKESANKTIIIKNSDVMPPCYINYNGNNVTYEVPAGAGFVNLFNKETITDGKYMGPNGATSSASSLCYSEKIDVEPGDVLYFWNGSTKYKPRFITAFNESGSAIAASGSNDPQNIYTVPEGIDSVIVTVYNSALNTFMVFKNDDGTPPAYVPYVKESNNPGGNGSNGEAGGNEQIAYGAEYLHTSGDMGTSTKLSVGKADIITDKHLIFTADVTSFEGLRLGHGYTDYTSGYVEIDNTYIKQYQYTSGTTMLKQEAHGLDIAGNIKVTIDVNNRRVATVKIESNGKSYTFSTSTTWYGSNGEIFAQSLGSVLPNAQLAFTCDGYSKEIQFYGDSYLSQSSDRWLYFAFQNGYKNALFDGYGGRGSGGAYASLVENLKHSNPKVVVWMMGMNDGSDSGNTPSSTWATNRDKLIALAEKEGFEIVFATIPTVPNINHEAKNNWIRNSGYRYIDVAEALGADGTGAWTDGYLSSDKVHPSAAGSQAIYNAVITDFPDFKK